MDELLEQHIHELDNISDETLRMQFFEFLTDLTRCTSFKMSVFAEDVPGEEMFKLMNYHINDGQVGASIRLEAIDGKGVHRNIEIFDIEKIERNTSDYSTGHMKYYFQIMDRGLYRDYVRQLELPKEIQNKEIIEAYWRKEVISQRCELYFEDNNALDMVLCNHNVIANFFD